MCENSPWRRGRKCFPGTRADVSLQPRVKTLAKQLYSCGTWGLQRSRDHLQSSGGPPLEQMEKEAVTPQGAQSGASLLAGFAIPWATHARTIHEELQPEVRAYIEEDYGRLSPMGDTPYWSRQREWGVLPLRRKVQQKQHVMDWSQPPFPVPLHHWGGVEDVENLWVKLNLGKREGWGGRSSKIFFCLFYFSLPTLIWLVAN